MPIKKNSLIEKKIIKFELVQKNIFLNYPFCLCLPLSEDFSKYRLNRFYTLPYTKRFCFLRDFFWKRGLNIFLLPKNFELIDYIKKLKKKSLVLFIFFDNRKWYSPLKISYFIERKFSLISVFIPFFYSKIIFLLRLFLFKKIKLLLVGFGS